MTIAEFDRLVDDAPDPRLLELVDGAIVMQSNPTRRHGQIASNLGAPIKLAMDVSDCRTYLGDIRIQRDDNSKARDKPRPDVVVHCGPVNEDTYVTDPVLVVEVLSPSTMDVDRGPKLRFYKSLPTLMHIVIVYQDQVRLEHYERVDGAWEHRVLTRSADMLRLASLDFEIGLDRVYFGVTL
jgi:Uma2 family endonuclease